MKEFIGVDGEGVNRDDKHKSQDYTFLAASTGESIEEWEYGGLSTVDCFDFLIGLHVRYPSAYLVGFSFSYDSTMFLRDFHRIHAEKLNEENRVSYTPRVGLRYFIEFIPSKWFSVSRSVWRDGQWRKDGYAKVWDVFGFYQTSFVKSLKAWQVTSPEEIDVIEKMKEQRGEFKPEEKEEIKAYCFRECNLLVRMVEMLEESLQDAGLDIRQYHGPGAIANKLLGMHHAKSYLVRLFDNDDINKAVLHAYFGGRIETMVAGYVPDKVFRYDINSAYPAALVNLPNLRDGEWSHTTSYESGERYALWRVSWKLKRLTPLAPFPYRNGTDIFYCEEGAGWYHAPEVLAAKECGIPIQVHEGWVFKPNQKEFFPFHWVQEIYTQRQQFKKEGRSAEKALKLGLNSLYGKFAQGVSQGNRPGQYQCYYFAGYITSYCRAKALRAAMQHPESILAIATDGILSLKPLDLPQSNKLGEWSEEEPIENGLMIVKAGFWLTRTAKILKSRGINAKTVDFDMFYEAWQKRGVYAFLTTSDSRFVGVGRALNECANDTDFKNRWRRWRPWEASISFVPDRKAFRSKEWWSETFIKLYPVPAFEGHTFSDVYTPMHLRKVSDKEAEAEPVEEVDTLTVAV